MDSGSTRAGEHAQRGQRLEDREPVPVEVLQQTQNLGPLPLQAPVVGGAVSLIQTHVLGVLELGGKLQVDVVLGAAEHERSNSRAQP